MSRYHSLRVSSVRAETHDAKSLVFEVPAALAEEFRYQPGQFLTLRLPIDGRFVPRCYSMSSAFGLDAWPRVTIKRVPLGRGSNWVCDQVKAGDVMEVMAPSGVFVPRSLEGDFLLMAGGSGVTPVFSILRSVLDKGQGRITLLYANRDEQSVIFRAELQALALAHPARLQVTHWLDSVQGIPSVSQLTEWARGHVQTSPQAQAFICGPGLFMEAAVAALQALDMPSEQMHVERFVSLPDEAALADAKAAAHASAAVTQGVEEAEIELSLQGEVHTFRCGGQDTLLDAALRAGLNVPYSCQAGMCASCMCQVMEGSVHLRHNDVLDDKDLAKAWTLACQAVPTSPRLRIKFPE